MAAAREAHLAAVEQSRDKSLQSLKLAAEQTDVVPGTDGRMSLAPYSSR